LLVSYDSSGDLEGRPGAGGDRTAGTVNIRRVFVRPAAGLWRRFVTAIRWTPPTSSEVGTVARSGLAAGLAWWLAEAVTDEASPVLASLTAVVVVQVSVMESMRTALQRSAAVVLGVLIGLAIGDALELNAAIVAVLVAASLAVAELLLRLPRAAARQVPVSVLVVLSAVSLNPTSSGWHRAVDTVLGAVVGVVISLAWPTSRVVEARQALQHLADGLSSSLIAMGSGLHERWSTDQTEEWRRTARTVRERLVADASKAIDGGRESVRWNVRDRPRIELFERLDVVMPRLERAAIGVSVISRGLDDHARLSGTTHEPMASMGALLTALGESVRALTLRVLGGADTEDFQRSLDDVRERRVRCVQGASRRARSAVAGDRDSDLESLEGEWLNYAALLVQVDRIVADLCAPVPA
jgi:uncharacterized membrane protein YgaE (UPF0421/DUF939 family)